MDETELWIERISQEILAHTARHPRAADTLPGIARFWLRDTRNAPEPLIERALDRLVKARRLWRCDERPDLYFARPPSAPD